MNYATEEMREKFNKADKDHKDSPYYMRIKLEYSVVAKHFSGNWARTLTIVVLSILLYGAMCLKYSSGAESFEQVVSQVIYGHRC